MSDKQYSIGHAESIGVVVVSGIWTIEYDIAQVQDDEYALYDIPELEWDEYNRIDDLSYGDSIPIAIASHAVDELGHVYGFVVPDYLLGVFIENFPELEVYRR